MASWCNDVAPLWGNVADAGIRTARTSISEAKNVTANLTTYLVAVLLSKRRVAEPWDSREEEGWKKGKGRDLGYALATNSCEGAIGVEYAPSRPSMRSLLSQFQTPTTPRRAVGFFGSGRSLGRPNELITQLTLDWLLFILANPFSRRRGKGKHFATNCQCRLLVQTRHAKTSSTRNADH